MPKRKSAPSAPKPKIIHKDKRKIVNLALQGGGAHGAFAWGALDALLEDGRIDIEGVCATSAGSMNACVLADGLIKGGPKNGRDVARESLYQFWWKLQEAGKVFSPIRHAPWEQFFSNGDNSLSYMMFDAVTHEFSPYQLNPMQINPLRDIMAEMVDFKALQKPGGTKLFITATHVKSGKARVFSGQDVTLDVVMASACLPTVFQAVMIYGEPYWDGGYTGNPSLWPLFYKTDSRDVIIVHLNPIERDDLPDTAPEIANRLNEISFNSSLIQEIRAIAFVKELLEYDMLKEEYRKDFKDILVHSIRADQALKDLSVASKYSIDWDFLTGLKESGRHVMKEWLKANYNHIGERGSVDLDKEFLTSVTDMFKNYTSRHKPKDADITQKAIHELTRQQEEKARKSTGRKHTLKKSPKKAA